MADNIEPLYDKPEHTGGSLLCIPHCNTDNVLAGGTAFFFHYGIFFFGGISHSSAPLPSVFPGILNCCVQWPGASEIAAMMF